MKEPKAPTIEELLVELEKTTPRSAGGKTVAEWSEFWGVCYARGRALVHLAIKQGRMTTQPTHRPDIGRPGRRVMVFEHSFKPKGKR